MAVGQYCLHWQTPPPRSSRTTRKAGVGNLLDIPLYHSWLEFKEWADCYGLILQLNLAGPKHVVLATDKVANDLLCEKGTYYSSREYLPMASGIVSREMQSVVLPYNAADSYQPVQNYESKRLLVSLIERPFEYDKWFEQYASDAAFRIGFGKWVEMGEEIREITRVNHNL
ncbi:hypothetical protein BJX64DRAFT_290897 [Aspergillus heterothallicus]